MADHDVAGYAGDVTPEEAWEILKEEGNAVLLDVRTAAEWSFVGVSDLSDIGKEPTKVEWKSFSPTGMVENPDFVEQVKAACPDKDAKILSLCRSGQRSISTSVALSEAGYTQAFNIMEGFEGNKDDNNHRATVGGWKMRGLPWRQ